ncbi:hypothetical protein FOIG_13082 [Fusarium odoratissimum NRRL 54006]|uniref:Uncharacterized protein n=2 Tax=Fusarium oxysporum species complex TaxID=171631 RepID=X0KB09_FUSO5|nr:uncharacterized protein FOIG_13082 [Fusarium odoratissimum NRRL 54006]EXL94184.1 hypothetical protein FOIG_13082 [Fusarium odoratissimum NRRL 54006]TXC06877.1 hypothetical protein FocTR4_00010442 [Fusarium oxysporum f. sp. cubense]
MRCSHMVRPPLESHDIFRKVKENFETTGLRRSRCMQRGHIHCEQTPSDRVLHNGNVTTKTISRWRRWTITAVNMRQNIAQKFLTCVATIHQQGSTASTGSTRYLMDKKDPTSLKGSSSIKLTVIHSCRQSHRGSSWMIVSAVSYG